MEGGELRREGEVSGGDGKREDGEGRGGCRRHCEDFGLGGMMTMPNLVGAGDDDGIHRFFETMTMKT